MEDLIPISNQGTDLLADSRNVAELFSVTHAHIRDQISKNEDQLKQLGQLRIETEVVKGHQGGGNPVKFFWLNFDQIAFLLTLSRVTEKNKEFRLKLIVAFRNAREGLRPIDSILLTLPDRWKQQFPNDFYKALLALYGAEFDGSKNKPSWVGNWTNKFIYEPLFDGLPHELKRRRFEFASKKGREADYFKMHQFLEQHARQDLRDHITKITTILTLANSKQDFIESFASIFHGHHQLKMLLSGLQKDFG